MRLIGHLQSESVARTFSDYLYVQGIKNQIEAEKDGTWALWIHSEDEIEKSRGLLEKFLARPGDSHFQDMSKQVQVLKEREKEQEESAARRLLDARQIFRQHGPYGIGWLTLGLIAASALVWVLREYGPNKGFWNCLFISEYDVVGGSLNRLIHGLPEVRHGQVWRIVTPIFLHFHVLHILFNMLWLKDLGSMVEARQSSCRLALLVLCIGAASNLGQYWVQGPEFGGMSGVVYGLLGYIWMKGTFDPASGYFLQPSTVGMMLIWFVLCFTPLMPIGIANTVHAIGLGMGIAWGYLSAIWRRR